AYMFIRNEPERPRTQRRDADRPATPILLGHRGHRLPAWREPENSLPAFDRALAAGCAGFEFDLRLTADGRVVIHHDPGIQVGGARVEVASTSLRALRRLQPQLATLEQVLRRYRDRAWLDLEVKAIETVPRLAEALARWPPRRGFVVSSFDLPTLRRLASLAPAAPRCLNLRRPISLRRLRQAQVTWVAPQQASCTAWYVRRLRAQGWQVLVWTVNRPSRMRLLARAGADALVSDDPYMLVQTVKQT
ncbi:MAG: glycerophosphodiester phosphodiesterase, partial [Terriglobales bacterium]